MSEQELVAGCQRGDRDAQRALYERTIERVWRLLLRMTRSHTAAEDLAQDTYLKAFTAIGAFDGRSSVSTWLYRIALNEALQWLRRRPLVAIDPTAVARRSDPRDYNEDAATRIDVESALAALEPVDRAMLLLRYQEGLDYRSIAEVTEIALGTVASRLNRARARLRELLGESAPDREENAERLHRMNRGAGGR